MSSVRELYLHTDRGVHSRVTALVVEKDGIVGDMLRGTDKPQVCLCDAAVMDVLPGMRGLCVRRFIPNVTTEGLAYARLAVGQLLTVGGTVLAVARVGKACFPACEMFAGRDACLLRQSCAFLTVKRAGRIQENDSIMA